MGYRINCAVRVVCACCLLLVSWTAFAQDSGLPDIPKTIEAGDIDPISIENQPLKQELELTDLNRITLQQMGDMNQAFIQQHSKNSPNLVKVHQDGDDNISKLGQTGMRNATDIVQIGNNNSYSGIHIGDHIINTVIQNGDGNFIEQYLEADYLDFQLKQTGNNHELFQTETRDGIGYKVTQSGSVGMKITISQGNIYK